MPAVTTLRINGAERSLKSDPERTLLSVLRDDLALTGAKYGCGEGQCGACTVLVDGSPVRSCRTKVGAIATKAIRTVEGLEQDGKLHPIQQGFLEADAMQCAYCTCGFIMAGVALLEKNPTPSERDIIRALDGNICRCGVYPRILAAVQRAAALLKEAK